MPSSHLKNYLIQAVERLLARIIGSVASDCEADALINEAEYLDRLEELARRYEAEDKAHIAERIRIRARVLTGSAVDAPRIDSLPEAPETQALPNAMKKRRRRSQWGEDE